MDYKEYLDNFIKNLPEECKNVKLFKYIEKREDEENEM